MGSHNAGGRRHPRVDETKRRRIVALLNGSPILEPEPSPVWRAQPDEVKLHVSNLDYSVVEADVRELFSRCGEVTHCHLFMDTLDGRRMSRGFACVKMRGQASGDAALAMNGWIWAGRDLKIKVWGK